MTLRQSMAAVSFAHLLGLGVRAEDDDDARKGKRARKAEDDKDDDKKASKRAEDDDKKPEDEDDDKASRRAEDDESDDKDDDKKDSLKTKKASSKSRAEGDDEDDGDEDDSSAKADDDDDTDEDMRGKGAAAKARIRERARCEAIFSCAAAGSRPDVAANLAFRTKMTRREAIAVLKSTAAGDALRTTSAPSGGRSSLDSRMASLKVPVAGADAGPAAPAGMSSVAAAIVAAGAKARAQ